MRSGMDAGAGRLPNIVEAAAPDTLWHVLQTRPRQEKVLASDLAAMGIEHFLPLRTSTRHYGVRKQTSELPLFLGYVFLFGTLDQAYLADRTRRVAQIIRVVDQGQLKWELDNLRLALSGDATLDPYPYLAKGVRVEVRAGPFRGLQGIIEERGRVDRLILQIEMLGRAVGLDIDCALLEPLGSVAAMAV